LPPTEAILLFVETIVTVSVTFAVISYNTNIIRKRIAGWSFEKSYFWLSKWGIVDESYRSFWRKHGVSSEIDVRYLARMANVNFSAIVIANIAHMSVFVFIMNRIFH
jgi:hypothetical protein